jgi:2,3-bisphosphoglycerate-dependent phosphoglycerate mutase
MAEETTEPRTRIRTIVVFSLLFAVFAAVVLFGYWTTFSRPTTTVIVVRHAEKNNEPNNPNPDLTTVGQTRAQELARVLANSGVTTIFATQYGRTVQTVQPLAYALHISVTQVDAKNTAELIRQIDQHRGETILVSGHSNTVPGIIEALGGSRVPEIPDGEHDNLYVLSIYRYGKAKVLRLRYGAGNGQ